MTAYLLHGCVENWLPKKQIFRNYVDRSTLEAHLSLEETQYGDWQHDGSGNILTIDDSTKAGADACLLARKYGHRVIFFINPFQVISQEPYFFSLFDDCLDSRSVNEVEFQGCKYDLKVRSQLREFRLAARSVLMAMGAREAVQGVKPFADLLHVETFGCPSHALPLTVDDLIELKAAGVQLESHGWDHRCIASMNDSAVNEDLDKTKDWMKEVLAVDSRLYAVPYGLKKLHDKCLERIDDSYFLVNEDFPLAKIGDKCWNRVDLTTSIRPTVPC